MTKKAASFRRLQLQVYIVAASISIPILAAAAQRNGDAPVPCALTTLAQRKLPSGPAQYQSGTLVLKNGASLRLQGTSAELYHVAGMRVGDPIATCYGPLKTYADAGPARTITVLDLKSGNYYGTLVGNWKMK